MRTAYIGLGANLSSAAGSPEATLAAAAERLAALGRITAKSSLYSTEPVGYSEQPRFVNGVVGLETELSPRALLDSLLNLEREFGRDRTNSVPNGPRTLDLDLLLFGEGVIDEPGFHLPHPRLAERAFVLVPLNEIAAEAVDSRSGKTVAELLRQLANSNTAGSVVKIDSDSWRAQGSRIAAGK